MLSNLTWVTNNIVRLEIPKGFKLFLPLLLPSQRQGEWTCLFPFCF